VYLWNGQVSGNLTCTVAILNEYDSIRFMWNCLSAIRFRGGVILQVSCYTLLTPIPTSVATVLMSTPHGTPFRLSEGWSRYALALLILRTSGWIPHRQNCLPVMAHYESSILANKIQERSDLLFFANEKWFM